MHNQILKYRESQNVSYEVIHKTGDNYFYYKNVKSIYFYITVMHCNPKYIIYSYSRYKTLWPYQNPILLSIYLLILAYF